MRYLLTFFLPFAFYCGLVAQQLPQYSMYMLNKYAFNPAYAGFDNTLSATGVIRKQWAGLDKSPFTQHFNAHTPLNLIGGGVGILFENDVIGASKNTLAMLSINNQIPLGSGILSFGASGGIYQKSFDGSKLKTPEGDYNETTISHNDHLVPEGKVQALTPVFDAGVYFKGKIIETGLSAKNLLERNIEYDDLKIQLLRNYFFTFGLNFELTNNITIHPSILLKSDIKQTQIDFSAIVRYDDNIFGGVAFRGYDSDSMDAVSLLAGLKLSEKITVAYSYDLTLSSLKLVSNGSHEVMINYNLNKPFGTGKLPPIIFNPRNL